MRFLSHSPCVPAVPVLPLHPPSWIEGSFFNPTEIVDILLGAGARLTDSSLTLGNALFLACLKGDTSMVSRLLDAGREAGVMDTLIKWRNKDHVTVLMVACMVGRSEIVQMLLAHGSDPNTVECWRHLPLSFPPWCLSEGVGWLLSEFFLPTDC